jgi:pyruvate/2-oxoglutarate dehydrogenase complex dihydrolipoamide dehydrogenase (E3) component
MPLIKKRKDEIVMQSRNGGQHAAEKTKGLDVVFGEATFTGDKTVSVKLKNGKKQTLQADLIFLNVGPSRSSRKLKG